MTYSHGSDASWSPETPGLSHTVLTCGAYTHPGHVRSINEDGWLTSPPLFVVADGMGGHSAGDVASAIVVSEFDDLARAGDVRLESITATISNCQARITELSTGAENAPGSTLVSAAYVIEGGLGYWLLASIGDSRAYVWSSAGLEQISHDHSVVQELLDSGAINAAEARAHPERHVITRALGALEDSPPDFSLIPVVGGSRLLLCSDGVTSELSDQAIGDLLAGPGTAHSVAHDLVAAALAAGGHDNATAIVVDVVAEEARELEDVTSGRPNGVNEDTVRNARVVP
jgi:serine/threonine protein phosphatase PrpC